MGGVLLFGERIQSARNALLKVTAGFLYDCQIALKGLRGNFCWSRGRFNCNGGAIETTVSGLRIYSVMASAVSGAAAATDLYADADRTHILRNH
jgi:hypothetical protein